MGTLKVCIQRKVLTSQTLTIPVISAVIICGLSGRHLTPTKGELCPLRRKIFYFT